MVTIWPSFIKVLMTSAAFTDIFCASAATVMVSGTSTSCTIGSVGNENACEPLSSERTLTAALWARQPSAPPKSPRVLMARRRALSSRPRDLPGDLLFALLFRPFLTGLQGRFVQRAVSRYRSGRWLSQCPCSLNRLCLVRLCFELLLLLALALLLVLLLGSHVFALARDQFCLLCDPLPRAVQAVLR